MFILSLFYLDECPQVFLDYQVKGRYILNVLIIFSLLITVIHILYFQRLLLLLLLFFSVHVGESNHKIVLLNTDSSSSLLEFSIVYTFLCGCS